jgi:hypothetical protein
MCRQLFTDLSDIARDGLVQTRQVWRVARTRCPVAASIETDSVSVFDGLFEPSLTSYQYIIIILL